jgi:hypothetical protein
MFLSLTKREAAKLHFSKADFEKEFGTSVARETSCFLGSPRNLRRCSDPIPLQIDLKCQQTVRFPR